MYAQGSIGRVRRTRVVSPSEAAYVQQMNAQVDAINNKINTVIKRVKNATPEAIRYAIKEILDRSDELVPVDTGRLKASRFVAVEETAKGTRVLFGYARYGQPHYAAFVHERTDIRHAKGKQAKFLETAVNERLRNFQYRISEYIKKASGLTSEY